MGLFGTKKIGKYEIGRTIGEGNFAKVKLGYDTTNGTYVAVKIIDKALVIQKGLQSQVQREIRTMKLLNHPNIVQIHEVLYLSLSVSSDYTVFLFLILEI